MRPFTRRSSALPAPALMAALVTLAACHTAARRPFADVGGPPAEMAVTNGGVSTNVTYRLNRSDGGVTGYVKASPDEVWKALLVVYSDLEIPATTVVPTKRQLSGRIARAPRKLDGERMHVYLDCGSGLTGPRADSYDVALVVRSAVLPAAGDSTAIFTALSASATSRGGTNGAPVNCVTTGQLERRIASAVRLQLTR